MSDEQKTVVKAMVEYKPPTWIKVLVAIAKATRWIGALGAAGGVLSGYTTTKWGVIIFAAAYGLGKVTELLGDFLDDQKFNDSFKELLGKE